MAQRITAETTEGLRESITACSTDSETYLTPEEVAARLRVSRRTVYEWLKLGRLRGLRAGKAWRIRPEDVEALMMPEAAWEQRLDQMLARVRSHIPADLTPEEIEADITAARDEVRQAERARGR
jgi:excisionase family DNA binding protein